MLTTYLGKFSSAHLRNSLDFKRRIMKFCEINDMSEVRIVSFDVTSHFTSMPLEPMLSFTKRKLDEDHRSIPIPKVCFLNLIRICANDNVFQFEIRQKFGVAMRSPLFPALANLIIVLFGYELLADIMGKPAL